MCCSMSGDSYGINGQGQLWHSSTPDAELSAPFASRDVIGMGVIPGKKQIFLTYAMHPIIVGGLHWTMCTIR